jgi:arginine exporter protein ArgO
VIWTLPSRQRAIVTCLLCALATLMCAGLATCAALAPAPPAVVPFVVLVSIVCPMLLALDVPAAVAVLRATGRQRDRQALDALRRGLAELPEVNHPLGL